jgi:hypothetical protein
MCRDLIVIDRVDDEVTDWYHAVIPNGLLQKVLDRIPLSCFPDGPMFTSCINIFGDYYTYFYYNPKRDTDNLEVLYAEYVEFGNIFRRLVSRDASGELYTRTGPLISKIGGDVCVTCLCGCYSQCFTNVYPRLHAVLEIRDMIYCVSFDLLPLKCALHEHQCAACYVFTAISDYFMDIKKQLDTYTDVVRSFLNTDICRISNAKLLTRVTEKVFCEILQKEVQKP